MNDKPVNLEVIKENFTADGYPAKFTYSLIPMYFVQLHKIEVFEGESEGEQILDTPVGNFSNLVTICEWFSNGYEHEAYYVTEDGEELVI